VEALDLGEGFEPGGDVGVALLPGGAGEVGVHVRVLVGLAGHRGFEVGEGIAQGHPGGGIAGLGGEEHEVLEGVARLAVGAVAEEVGHVGPALLLGHLGHPGVAAVGLALAGEGGLQVQVGLGFGEAHGFDLRGPRGAAPGVSHIGARFLVIVIIVFIELFVASFRDFHGQPLTELTT
jgi:hypothetical protein